MKKYLFLFLLIMIALAACQSEAKNSSANDFSNCKYGKPKAIFPANLPSIADHQFEIKDKTAIENITLKDGLKIEIFQLGCNHIEQEFHFFLAPNSIADEQELFKTSLELFGKMANLDESLKPFDFWASAIADNASKFKKGKKMELQQNIFVQIDHIDSSDHTLLRIVLKQDS